MREEGRRETARLAARLSTDRYTGEASQDPIQHRPVMRQLYADLPHRDPMERALGQRGQRRLHLHRIGRGEAGAPLDLQRPELAFAKEAIAESVGRLEREL